MHPFWGKLFSGCTPFEESFLWIHPFWGKVFSGCTLFECTCEIWKQSPQIPQQPQHQQIQQEEQHLPLPDLSASPQIKREGERERDISIPHSWNTRVTLQKMRIPFASFPHLHFSPGAFWTFCPCHSLSTGEILLRQQTRRRRFWQHSTTFQGPLPKEAKGMLLRRWPKKKENRVWIAPRADRGVWELWKSHKSMCTCVQKGGNTLNVFMSAWKGKRRGGMIKIILYNSIFCLEVAQVMTRNCFNVEKTSFIWDKEKWLLFFLPQVFEEGKAISSIFSPFIFFWRIFSSGLLNEPEILHARSEKIIFCRRSAGSFFLPENCERQCYLAKQSRFGKGLHGSFGEKKILWGVFYTLH